MANFIPSGQRKTSGSCTKTRIKVPKAWLTRRVKKLTKKLKHQIHKVRQKRFYEIDNLQRIN